MSEALQKLLADIDLVRVDIIRDLAQAQKQVDKLTRAVEAMDATRAVILARQPVREDA